MSSPSARWQPARAGIRNIWEYDDQVFAFADGRMILRGPNGSGKSNALALIFPFLIDGSMSAGSMDPFAGGRSMKSLLLGVERDDARARRFRHDQRTGYVWLELARPADGGAEHITIGCGARASAQRDATSWFFVTDRRVGVDLDLAPGGEPLVRKRLAEELGADAVFDTAESYRQAVDRALFGVGPDRHRKLVQLIRVLRRPQLAGKLDPDLLSAVLAEGLPAVSPRVLDDVANSLDDLDAIQQELADLSATRKVIDAFVPTYRTYLVVEVAERAGAVVDARRARTRAERELTAARRAVAEAEAALVANEEARQRAQESQAAAEARRQAVVDSPGYRDATALREVATAADTAERAEQAARARRDDADTAAERAAGDADEARAEAARAETAATATLTALVDAADAADAAWTLSPEEAVDPDRLEAEAGQAVRARREDLRVVRGALTRRGEAIRDHARAELAASDALAAADRSRREADDAAASLTAARQALGEALERWLVDDAPLDPDQGAELRELAELAGEPGAGDLASAYREMVRPRREHLAQEQALSGRRQAEIEAEVAEVEAERAAVEAEADPGPTPPAWRRADRDARRGAPLWACCDFRPDVADADRAGLEAALAAAGILDAWISPAADAADRPDTDLDAWLVAAAVPPSPEGPTLIDVLVPALPEDAGLVEVDVEAALATIGLGAVGIAVGSDGGFVLGPLRGRAAKAEPEFVGAAARAERRRRRLAELTAQLDVLHVRLADEQGVARDLAAERDRIDAAEASLPSTGAVEVAHRTWTRAEARADAEREVAARAETAEAEAAAAVEEATRRVAQAAAERRLGTTSEELDAVDAQVSAIADRAGAAVAARRTATGARATATREESRAAEAASLAAVRTQEWSVASREAVEQRSRAVTLRAQVGADADAAVAALADADTAIAEARAERTRLDDDRVDMARDEGGAKERVSAAEVQVQETTEAARASTARLAVLRRRDVLAALDVDVDTDDLPADAEELGARLVAVVDRPRPTDEERQRVRSALDRAQKALLDELPHTYDAAIGHVDEVTVVEVTSDAGTFPLARLAAEVADQQTRLEELLTEGDRELFERFLLDQVSHELRRLLADAEEFVHGVNQALAKARTASGLAVELRWEVAADDPTVREATRLLRRDVTHLGTDDLATLRAFFQRVIGTHRAERPDGGYRQALEAALDYRAWHEFRPYLRTPTGGATRLTRDAFRQLSGGEQAVSLHLPLFAAAAAHYDRAESTAPRLIALDEAFAGIDEAMRAELMALIVFFRLDVVMTGHELWGAYAQVPAVAIHDLLRRPPAEGVSVVSLRWDGRDMVDEVAGG